MDLITHLVNNNLSKWFIRMTSSRIQSFININAINPVTDKANSDRFYDNNWNQKAVKERSSLYSSHLVKDTLGQESQREFLAIASSTPPLEFGEQLLRWVVLYSLLDVLFDWTIDVLRMNSILLSYYIIRHIISRVFWGPVKRGEGKGSGKEGLQYPTRRQGHLV